MYLPINLYKAVCHLDPDANIAENVFSHISSSKINLKEINLNVNESMTMRVYYSTLFNYYVKKELELSEQQAKRIANRKCYTLMYNSFRLLHKLFKLLKEDFSFKTHLVLYFYFHNFYEVYK